VVDHWDMVSPPARMYLLFKHILGAGRSLSGLGNRERGRR
jgi:hypothetical protein